MECEPERKVVAARKVFMRCVRSPATALHSALNRETYACPNFFVTPAGIGPFEEDVKLLRVLFDNKRRPVANATVAKCFKKAMWYYNNGCFRVAVEASLFDLAGRSQPALELLIQNLSALAYMRPGKFWVL